MEILMTKLNSSTLRRLRMLKQSAATVWEGDRRALPRMRDVNNDSNLIHIGDYGNDDQPQYIIWVDGSMGMVRAMDIVEPDVGQEAFVRTLVQAMERPQGPAQPGRPQKILVCDRQLQFYLRGILQGLDITVEHVDQLPLIDEFFANIIEHSSANPPAVPSGQAPILYRQAELIWRNAPWKYLWDHEVLELTLNYSDVDKLYAVIMGRLGLEQGVIFYRSQDSLVQFRQRIAEDENENDLEETFLHQDCLFALFESAQSLSESEIRTIRSYGWSKNLDSAYPIFGMLHPLEGGRPFLYEEEAIALTMAIESLNLFLKQHGTKLKSGKFESLQGQYDLEVPDLSSESTHRIQVSVKTLPDLATEIHSFTEDEYDDEYDEYGEEDEDEEDEDESLIRDDLFPEHSLLQLLGMSWQSIASLRQNTPHSFLASSAFSEKGESLSSLLVQTSRPKALELIKQIEIVGGIKALCFNPAETFLGDRCELGIVVMGNGDLQLFREFHYDDPEEEKGRKRWKQRCKNTNGYCAVIIAMGVTGLSRGNPEPKHILGYYEVELISARDLGLGKLISQPVFGFDMDI